MKRLYLGEGLEIPAMAAFAAAAQGAFNNPCGRLRSIGLIDYPSKGFAVARSVLFVEGGVA